VNFENVNKLQVWYNNIPAGKEVNCVVGTVKALPLVPLSIKNPEIRIGDENIVFPVTMESGMYLEFMSEHDCRLYGSKGELLQEVKIEGKIPILKKGDNLVSFHCMGPAGISSRVQITVIAEGEPL